MLEGRSTDADHLYTGHTMLIMWQLQCRRRRICSIIWRAYIDRSLQRWKMSMKIGKTRVMEVSRVGGSCEVRVWGEQVEAVKAMKYLGVMLGSDGTMDEEVEHRIGAATDWSHKQEGIGEEGAQ